MASGKIIEVKESSQMLMSPFYLDDLATCNLQLANCNLPLATCHLSVGEFQPTHLFGFQHFLEFTEFVGQFVHVG